MIFLAAEERLEGYKPGFLPRLEHDIPQMNEINTLSRESTRVRAAFMEPPGNVT